MLSNNCENKSIRDQIMSDKNPLSLIVPQDIMRLYGSRVRTLRIQAEITQKELAQRAGISEGTIKRFDDPPYQGTEGDNDCRCGVI